jgi:multiple sugar transport system permease protein
VRNRTRHGWHRYINGVSISTFLILAFVLLPMYWMLATSFKTTANIGASPPQFFPHPISGASYQAAFGDYTFGRYIINSAVVALCATFLVLFFGTLAG